MGKSGYKFNPNAPEFYPSSASPQMPKDLPIKNPSLPRSTPQTEALHATGRRKLLIFNVAATLTNTFLHRKFQKYGAVEKIENSPNAERTRFVTFFNEDDENGAKRRLNGKKVGPWRSKLVIELLIRVPLFLTPLLPVGSARLRRDSFCIPNAQRRP